MNRSRVKMFAAVFGGISLLFVLATVPCSIFISKYRSERQIPYHKYLDACKKTTDLITAKVASARNTDEYAQFERDLKNADSDASSFLKDCEYLRAKVAGLKGDVAGLFVAAGLCSLF